MKKIILYILISLPLNILSSNIYPHTMNNNHRSTINKSHKQGNNYLKTINNKSNKLDKSNESNESHKNIVYLNHKLEKNGPLNNKNEHGGSSRYRKNNNS